MGLLITNGNFLYAQQKEKTKAEIEKVSYTDSSDLYQHTSFVISYQIKSNLFVEVQEYYDEYPFANILKKSIIGKKYIADRMYLFLGAETEFISLNSENWIDAKKQVRLLQGLGYDVSPGFSMEAGRNLDFSTKRITPITNPNAFSVKGKLKF